MAEIAAAMRSSSCRVNGQGHFTAAAKAEFSEKADAWLIPPMQRPLANFWSLYEVRSAWKRVRRVPIPNVCEAFWWSILDTFEMSRSLGAECHWNG